MMTFCIKLKSCWKDSTALECCHARKARFKLPGALHCQIHIFHWSNIKQASKSKGLTDTGAEMVLGEGNGDVGALLYVSSRVFGFLKVH